MLGRLIKYDFLALGRALLPVQLAVVLVGVVSSAFLTFNIRYSYNQGSGMYGRTDNIETLLVAFSGFALLLLVVVLAASSVVTLFLVARHFYQNFMGDEGYLSFTLPVTVHQHILSKTISGFIWMVVNILALLVALAIVVFFGTAYEGLINTDVFYGLEDALHQLINRGGGLLLVAYPASFVITTLNAILMVYFCITIGSVLAKKHKVAGAVVAYFALATVVGIVSALADFVVRTLTGGFDAIFNLTYSNNYSGVFNYLQVGLLTSTVMALLTIVAYYLLNHYFLSNRLNLE